MQGQAAEQHRAAGADEKLILAPPVQISLEKALEYISEDELVEITPNHIRLRKKVLAANMRSVVRGEKRKDKQPEADLYPRCPRWRRAWSNKTMAIMASTMGTALGTTQGSCRPRGLMVVASPPVSTVS